MKPHWIVGMDGEFELSKLYERHYSAKKSLATRLRRHTKKFCGPGEIIVLTNPLRNALFVWRKFKDDIRPTQEGICCAIFRNEGSEKSSDLIREADAIADFCWPGQGHYTTVRGEAVKSRNPGYCFIRAGWKRVGTSTGQLVILRRFANSNQVDPKKYLQIQPQPVGSHNPLKYLSSIMKMVDHAVRPHYGTDSR